MEDYKFENPHLHKASLDLLNLMVPEIFNDDFIVKKCKISMQVKHMDFLIEINDAIILHFEDKIKSGTSQGQLTKYKKTLSYDYPNHTIYNIYLKSDLIWADERNLVLSHGYKVFDLRFLAESLSPTSGNDIYDNFVLNVIRRLDNYDSYKRINPNSWAFYQWIGFLIDLSFHLDYVNFGKHYVGEDFWLTLSWQGLNRFENCHVSFEITRKRCVVKAHVWNPSIDRSEVLNHVKETLIPCFEGFKIKSYNRKAKCMMAIEIFDFIVTENEIIDLEKTKQRLNHLKKVFEHGVNGVQEYAL